MSDPHAMLTTRLDVRGYEILTAFPVVNLASGQAAKAQVKVANLGLMRKMAGAAAIESTVIKVNENGRALLDVILKALGILGIYISSLPSLTIDDDFIATIQGRVIPPHTVSISKNDEHILEIDVETAWKEMDLNPGWGNELRIKVSFTLR